MTVDEIYAKMGWERADRYAFRVASTYQIENPQPAKGTVEWEVVHCGRRTGRTTLACAQAVSALLNGETVVYVGNTLDSAKFTTERVREIFKQVSPASVPKGELLYVEKAYLKRAQGVPKDTTRYVFDCF